MLLEQAKSLLIHQHGVSNDLQDEDYETLAEEYDIYIETEDDDNVDMSFSDAKAYMIHQYGVSNDLEDDDYDNLAEEYGITIVY